MTAELRLKWTVGNTGNVFSVVSTFTTFSTVFSSCLTTGFCSSFTTDRVSSFTGSITGATERAVAYIRFSFFLLLPIFHTTPTERFASQLYLLVQQVATPSKLLFAIQATPDVSCKSMYLLAR